VSPRPDPTAPPLAGRRIAVLGCGAVGRAFAEELAAEGAELALWSRSPARARALRERLRRAGVPAARLAGASRPEKAVAGAEAALVCVPGSALEALTERLVRGVRTWAAAPPGALLHTSGQRGPGALAGLRGAELPAGAERPAIGKLHPLVALPADAVRGAGLRGGWFGVAGDPGALAAARRLVEALGGRVFDLAEGEAESERYHAAAALLAGGIVALFDAAGGPLASVGGGARRGGRRSTDRDGRAQARAALLGLASSVLENLAVAGAGDVLTGPVARGETATVRAHLAALDAVDPGAARVYRVLGQRMLALVRGRALGRAAARELEEALAEPAPRARGEPGRGRRARGGRG